MNQIKPGKLESNNSFVILSNNRSKFHQRRTLSGVLDLSFAGLHHKSFSSQLPSLSEDLNVEIQKIKEEVEQRCIEQKQREIMFESILGHEYTLNTEDIQINSDIKEVIKEEEEEKETGTVFGCRAWLMRCLRFVK
jgi:hypothetical protein